MVFGCLRGSKAPKDVVFTEVPKIQLAEPIHLKQHSLAVQADDETMKLELEQAHAKTSELEQEIGQLRQELAEANRREAEAIEDNEALSTRCEELEHQLEVKHAMCTAAQKTAQESNDAISKLQTQVAKLQRQMGGLTETKQAVMAQLGTTEAELQCANSRKDKLHLEVANLKTKLHDAKQDRNNMHARLSKMKEVMASIYQYIAVVGSDASQLGQAFEPPQITDADAAIACMRAAGRDKTKGLAALRQSADFMRRSLAELSTQERQHITGAGTGGSGRGAAGPPVAVPTSLRQASGTKLELAPSFAEQDVAVQVSSNNHGASECRPRYSVDDDVEVPTIQAAHTFSAHMSIAPDTSAAAAAPTAAPERRGSGIGRSRTSSDAGDASISQAAGAAPATPTPDQVVVLDLSNVPGPNLALGPHKSIINKNANSSKSQAKHGIAERAAAALLKAPAAAVERDTRGDRSDTSTPSVSSDWSMAIKHLAARAAASSQGPLGPTASAVAGALAGVGGQQKAESTLDVKSPRDNGE